MNEQYATIILKADVRRDVPFCNYLYVILVCIYFFFWIFLKTIVCVITQTPIVVETKLSQFCECNLSIGITTVIMSIKTYYNRYFLKYVEWTINRL